MFYRFLRDSFVGRLSYKLSGRKVFTYPEEQPDYVIPERYLPGFKSSKESEEIEKTGELSSSSSEDKIVQDDYIYVGWEGDDDPENPQNWPLKQKIFLIFEIAFLTTSVYMGAAIYTPGIDEIMEKFHIGETVAALPLTLFVIGYGIGPMVFSPMSEHPAFGRTYIYIITLFLFFILQIPTALAHNIAGLCILRFLSGFFASPALATGGASVSEVLSMPYAPVGIAAWSCAAVCGPSLGPLFGSIVTVKGSWRWTFWFMACISGASLLCLSFFLPETYSKTILSRKARRLRALTGNDKITTEDEVAGKSVEVKDVVIDTLWRPVVISLTEPVVFLINIYIALVYSILYLWFEAFPLVFLGVYKFTLIEMGVSYTSIMIGIVIGCALYLYWVRKSFTSKLLAGEPVAPEIFIPAAIIGAVLMPIGIFMFGWTAASDIHWIAPLIGAAIFAAGAFFIFQTLFNYLGMSFYRYLASVFASNSFFRSVIAGVFPLFGRSLFQNLKTDRFVAGWGSTILGFITIGMISIPVLFYINGPKLRARSPYAN